MVESKAENKGIKGNRAGEGEDEAVEGTNRDERGIGST